jgi:hypothetical protein
MTTDKIVDGFPHPTICPVNRIPTYTTISEVNLRINANVASVQSNLGNGTLGLLALTISPTLYTTLSNIPFKVPEKTQAPILTFLPTQQEHRSNPIRELTKKTS